MATGHPDELTRRRRVREFIANDLADAQVDTAVECADIWSRLAERLAWHLADCLIFMEKKGYGPPHSYGDDGAKALAEFRSLLPEGQTIPRDYQ